LADGGRIAGEEGVWDFAVVTGYDSCAKLDWKSCDKFCTIGKTGTAKKFVRLPLDFAANR
jgi:hypothetical protein